ncbi:hypothetical protein [Polaribacter porphyrae]|uniref:Uncharacterized protein n=1 Tax=Polaribacter porphyrae TaxID=1137780 RepID=A0A2S7WJB9_9FLAO|nr:hypothetical protein [Polaribacter porphyrae]PQJ77690.1 hypothetical protein BTO18_00160 [Polaribacter porphyrae]
MRVYQYGKILKVIGVICALILLFFSVAILFLSNNDAKSSINIYYFTIPFSIIFLPLSILGIRDVLISKVIIAENSITSITAISSRKLRIEEIQGFKRGRNYIHVHPKKRVFKKKLKFSIFFKNVDEILVWLSKNSNDLDAIEEENEIDDFYRNSEYGFSNAEKEGKLKSAKKVAKIINITSVLITISTIFFKEYKMISAWVLIAIPIIIICIVFYFKGLIKFADKEEDEVTIYPSIFWGFSAPIFLVFLIILLGIDIYEFKNLWIPLTLVSISIFILCILASKAYIIKTKKAYGKLTYLLLISFAYGHLLIVFFNVNLDNEAYVSYKTLVLEKDMSKGKTTSYYLNLTIPELNKINERFNVSSSVFDNVKVNDSVFFLLKEGYFNIPYYNIKTNE